MKGKKYYGKIVWLKELKDEYGKTYNCEMTPNENGKTIDVRGYFASKSMKI
jgi:hypothetical protein